MWSALVLGGALGLGQPPALPDPALARVPAAAAARPAEQPGEPPPANVNIDLPLPAPAPPPPRPPAAAGPDRWALMRTLQGTWYGAQLDDSRTSISGWTEGAYTASTARKSNLPVTWNDRANKFLLHQNVLRVDRAVDPAAAGATWGYHVDALFGSDYRYTLARGLFESQLLNSRGNQNLYGFDLVDFYVNAYFPGIFRGTEVAVGRFLTPVSSESELTILTPLLTRSMSFNWGGPFTHTGVSVTSKLTEQFTARIILATGNEVFIDPSQELRVVGSVVWTSEDARDVLTFNTTVGRGKFNAGQPFAPPTFATIQENAGRNNINVFDFIWTHQFSTRFTYQLELETGYQYGVPTTAAVGAIPGALVADDKLAGTAHWGSVVNYFFYKWTPRFTTITRVEAFDDFDGQRTGFKGLYTEVTTGFQYSVTKAMTVRPEVRYDYNGYSRPFEGKHGILTAALDAIVRW